MVLNLGEGDWQINSVAVTATAAELNYVDVTTPGVPESSKAIIMSAGGLVQLQAGQTIDFASEGANINIAGGAGGEFQIDSFTMSASAAELNFLDGALAGTQVASKAVVADANINIGVVKATALHIGASGAETQVTSTAAELNILDGVTSNKDELNLVDNQVGSVAFTPAGGVGSGTIQCTFSDAAAVQMATASSFKFWFSSVSTGLDFLPVTTSVVTSKGAVDKAGGVAGSDVFHGITDAAGEFDITVTAAADDYYMVVQLPSGKLQIAGVLTLT
jgi:hypothetical protein